MTTDRRTLMKYGLAALTALQTGAAAERGSAQSAGAPGAAPIAIEPNPGYRRIACEEAWTTSELVAAQLEWSETAAAREQPYVASMARGFAGNTRFQSRLQDIGAGRIADWTGSEFTCRCSC